MKTTLLLIVRIISITFILAILNLAGYDWTTWQYWAVVASIIVLGVTILLDD